MANRIVSEQLGRLIAAANDELFEPGMDSRFSEGLQRLYLYDPLAVLGLLKTRLLDTDTSSEVLAEMLCWASRQEAASVRGHVTALLTAGLFHSSSLVRDMAALGLASLLEDAAVVPATAGS